MKRVVVISDLHCGHLVGLTHPDFDSKPNNIESVFYQMWKRRNRYWKKYAQAMEQLQPIDVLIVNGDVIDGKGLKSGSTELLLADRVDQVECAIACIEQAKAKKVFMSYGTGYHEGNIDDWAKGVANGANVQRINSHWWIDVNGLTFDYKHHVGSSSVPYGRMTAIAKEWVWNIIKSKDNEYPESDIIIRSHVHYFSYGGGGDWLALTTPALQGHQTKYGERRMSGSVDWGLVYFDVSEKGEFDWKWMIYNFIQDRVVATKV